MPTEALDSATEKMQMYLFASSSYALSVCLFGELKLLARRLYRSTEAQWISNTVQCPNREEQGISTIAYNEQKRIMHTDAQQSWSIKTNNNDESAQDVTVFHLMQ